MVKYMRFVVTILMCVLLAGSVVAQQQASLEDVQKQLKLIGQMVSAQLGITDAQMSQFKALSGGYKQTCDTIRKSADSDDVKVQKMQVVADKAIPESMAVMTEQQKTTAIALGSALLSMYSSGSGVILNGSEIKGLLVKTGLSSEKAEAILGVTRSHSDKAKVIYADQSLAGTALDGKLKSLRLDTLAKISGKLDANEQKTMAVVLKSCQVNGKTFWASLTEAQQPKALTLTKQILRFFEETVTISNT